MVVHQNSIMVTLNPEQLQLFTDAIEEIQNRIVELETENDWLKSRIYWLENRELECGGS